MGFQKRIIFSLLLCNLLLGSMQIQIESTLNNLFPTCDHTIIFTPETRISGPFRFPVKLYSTQYLANLYNKWHLLSFTPIKDKLELKKVAKQTPLWPKISAHMSHCFVASFASKTIKNINRIRQYEFNIFLISVPVICGYDTERSICSDLLFVPSHPIRYESTFIVLFIPNDIHHYDENEHNFLRHSLNYLPHWFFASLGSNSTIWYSNLLWPKKKFLQVNSSVRGIDFSRYIEFNIITKESSLFSIVFLFYLAFIPFQSDYTY